MRKSSQINTAFVLGAGLGTRLRPLTEECPKPLVPVFHKPILTFALDHLIAAGVDSFVINTHHRPARFREYFAAGTYRGRGLTLQHEPTLLGTGGGMKNVQPCLGNEPFLVYSGDLLTDVDLDALIAAHFSGGHDVTLALRETGFGASIAERKGRVVDIGNRYGQEGTHDFANISVWNPSIFFRLPAGRELSFVPVLSDWIGAGGKIGGVILNEREWFNIGSRKEYLDVHRTISRTGWRPHYLAEKEWPVPVSPEARVAAGARIEGFSAIGPGVEVGEGAVVRDSILWKDAKIASRSHLNACIVRDGRRVAGEWAEADL